MTSLLFVSYHESKFVDGVTRDRDLGDGTGLGRDRLAELHEEGASRVREGLR